MIDKRNNNNVTEKISCLYSWLQEKRNESIEFLQHLIGFDSRVIGSGKSGKEKEIQDFISKYLLDLKVKGDVFSPDNDLIKSYDGYNPGHDYVDRPNVVGKITGRGSGRSLILNGHCDVVPPGKMSDWSFHPFKGYLDAGRLYGRGSCDMKAGLAAILWLVRAIRELKIDLNGDLFVESVVDEEGGGNGTLACVDRGYNADGAIIAEPTNLEIHITNKGALLGEFEVVGKPIHASVKGHGVNAIEKAFKIINSLQDLERKWITTIQNRLLSAPGITIGEIHGGIGASTVAGNCVVRFDAEFFSPEVNSELTDVSYSVDKSGVRKAVEDTILQTCKGDPWLAKNPVKVNWFQDTSTFFISQRHPLSLNLAEQLTKDGVVPKIRGFPAGCDAVYLTNIGKTPTVLFGPGNILQAHSNDEYVEIEQYLIYQKALGAFIIRWTESR